MYARLGWIWAQADTGAAVKFEAEVEEQMGNPLVRGDAKLMLRCLVTKAAIDQEKNEASARDIWEKILAVAKGLGDKRWEARAEAELGIITFMDGDVEKAGGMLKTALLSAYLLGDLGAAIDYGSIVGNGLVEVGQPETGLGYCETALKTTAATKHMGFPFMAYEGKAPDLVADRGMDMEAQVLEIIQELRETPYGQALSIKEITNHFIDRHGEDFERKITPHWIGHIVRRKLGLKTDRHRGGYTIADSELPKLARLCEKYGIDPVPEEGVNSVNFVNFPEGPENDGIV